MKVFVFAVMGAALMAGCAPFEHGHYSTDVSYRNTVGDPPGTPLVYSGDRQGTTSYGSTSYASAKPVHNWKQHGHSTASAAYAAPTTYSAPVNYAAQPVAYAQPVQYSGVQQATYVQPAAQSTYTAATTYGGVQYDAEGYAICDIPHSGHGTHAAHHTPHYSSRF